MNNIDDICMTINKALIQQVELREAIDSLY